MVIRLDAPSMLHTFQLRAIISTPFSCQTTLDLYQLGMELVLASGWFELEESGFFLSIYIFLQFNIAWHALWQEEQ